MDTLQFVKSEFKEKGDVPNFADLLSKDNTKVISYKKLISTYNLTLLSSMSEDELMEDDVSTYDAFYQSFIKPANHFTINFQTGRTDTNLTGMQTILARLIFEKMGVKEGFKYFDIDKYLVDQLNAGTLAIYLIRMDSEPNENYVKFALIFTEPLPDEVEVDKLYNIMQNEPEKTSDPEVIELYKKLTKQFKQRAGYLSKLNDIHQSRALYDEDSLRFVKYYNKVAMIIGY